MTLTYSTAKLSGEQLGCHMPRKAEIEEKARALLRDHDMLGVSVDPVKLANNIGVRVYNAKFGMPEAHGLLSIRQGRASIFVENDDSPARKRFTIAHELGHYLLHYGEHDTEHIDTSDSFRTAAEPESAWTPERRKEWEANVFAAALLMDEQLVRQRWRSVQDLEGLAAWFQVSTQAMAFRLDDLGLSA